jgi:hypothetical protein
MLLDASTKGSCIITLIQLDTIPSAQNRCHFLSPQHKNNNLTTSCKDNIIMSVKHSICYFNHVFNIVLKSEITKVEKMDYAQSIATYSLDQTNHVSG